MTANPSRPAAPSGTASGLDRMKAIHQSTEAVFQASLKVMLDALDDLGATETSLTGLATTLSPEAMLRLRSYQSRFHDLGEKVQAKATRSLKATRDLQELMRQTLDSLEDLRRLSRTAMLVSLNAVVLSRSLGSEGGTIDAIAREMRAVLEDVGHLVAQLGTKISVGRLGLEEVAVQAGRLADQTHATAIPIILDFAALVAERSRDRRVAQSASHVSQRFRILQDRVGEVVLHLQVGDRFRQRLEHASAILEVIEAPVPGLPTASLRILAAEQIRGALDDLRFSLRRAGRHLRALALMSAEIPRAGAIDVLRGSGAGGLAPLIAGAARMERTVEEVSQLSQELVSASRRLAATIGGAGEDADEAAGFERLMTVMGLNAILLASRLGVEGRAMEEVARQQRDIARQMIGLMGALRHRIEGIVSLSGALEGPDDGDLFAQLHHASGDAREVAALAEEIRRDLASSAAVRGPDTIAELMQRAGRELDGFAGSTSILEAIVRDLEAGSTTEADIAPEGWAVVDRIRRSYTMQAERQIHDRIFPARQPAVVANESEHDDIFFA